ncbi:MAG: substrate-binding domain-containing protein [Pedobacter sp.]
MKYMICLFALFLVSCANNSQSIKVKGSDTEVNLAVTLAENFYKINNDYSLSISGGGSGLGIASLLNGQTDAANSSRPINEEEEKLFKIKNIRLRTVVFAEDATAFIVQKSFPLDSIDVITLRNILSGQYRNWKQLTGQDMPINIYGRQSNSGTHSFIRKKLKIDFSREAKEMNGNAQIMQGIKTDKSGIGYVGVGYILHNGVSQPIKVLKISGRKGEVAISPLDKNAILAKRYYFQRPLYQFIPESSWKKVSAFIAYEKSDAGKRIIESSGYYILPIGKQL